MERLFDVSEGGTSHRIGDAIVCDSIKEIQKERTIEDMEVLGKWKMG